MIIEIAFQADLGSHLCEMKFGLLIILCSLLQQCVLIQTRTHEKILAEKALQEPFEQEQSFSTYRLKGQPGKTQVSFKVIEKKTVTTYKNQKFWQKVEKDKSIARNKKDQYKYYFAGPAWVTELAGPGEYAKTMLVATVMSLGVNLVIALGDWVSIPFRVGSSIEEREKVKKNKTGRKTGVSNFTNNATLKIGASEFAVQEGNVSLSYPEFFADKAYTYRTSKLVFTIIHGGKKRYERQPIADLFTSEDHFYQVYFQHLKSKHATAQNLVNRLIYSNEPGRIRQLVEQNQLDLNFQPALGLPPLHTAVKARKPETCRLLLQLGADAGFRDKQGKTAIDVAHQQLNNKYLNQGQRPALETIKSLLESKRKL